MGIIKELSAALSSQIAAGEVVERPASVVKELVENAIDAGATMITVRIEKGGISRIQVTDNGSGMMREDALECFKRHATSKIAKVEDLDAIYTMGFRGEALSSIAAVSQVDLYTKREQDEIGTHVVCADGEVQSCVDEGMPNGTTFVVSNLFYNIPARMKFLKKDSVEASYITDLMSRFILSHPEISFRYINSQKEIYFSAGDHEMTNCVYTVYGKDYAKGVVPVSYKQDYITVRGLVGKSDTVRPNRTYQSFFVNKRYIKSPLIVKAVEEAYKNRIMVGKYPMVVLNLDIDASMIDINVHPNKQEVKFSNESEIFRAVFHAVENALHSEYNIPKIERNEPDKSAFQKNVFTSDDQYKLEWEKNKNRWSPANEIKDNTPASSSTKREKSRIFPESYQCDTSAAYFEQRRKEILKENAAAGEDLQHLKEELTKPEIFVLPKSKTPFSDVFLDLNKRETPAEGVPSAEKGLPGNFLSAEKLPGNMLLAEERLAEHLLSAEKRLAENTHLAGEKPAENMLPNMGNMLPVQGNPTENAQLQETLSESALPAERAVFEPAYEDFKVVGQVFSTYIIVERGSEMLILDQHAAHERFKYEELKRELENKTVSAQDLLIPLSVDLSPVEHALYLEFSEFLNTLGFEAEDFGGNTILIRTAPASVDYDNIPQLLIELLGNISANKGKPVSQKAEYALYTIACKAAIKANHNLDMRELTALVSEVFKIVPINTCPHGRPIIISMTKKEIEKEFKRIL